LGTEYVTTGSQAIAAHPAMVILDLAAWSSKTSLSSLFIRISQINLALIETLRKNGDEQKRS
jgi:hypothetical protein